MVFKVKIVTHGRFGWISGSKCGSGPFFSLVPESAISMEKISLFKQSTRQYPTKFSFSEKLEEGIYLLAMLLSHVAIVSKIETPT